MAVTALQRPDFRTIGKFRARHLTALSGLFVQVLRPCQRAGLVRLGHVALDGTKVKANASKHGSCVVHDNVQGGVHVQVHVKVNVNVNAN